MTTTNNPHQIDYNNLHPSMWLPTTVKEMKALGWDYVDIVIFSGDAYIDHPSFGAAVIGRTLQAAGYRVAIVPQPNWQDDLRDFKKFGTPRLFFGISPGAMDSMVNHYTANRRRRSDDAYTPGGRHGARPDYPTIVYSGILRSLYPDTPIIAGGIEASLRRLSHYDYWQDRLRPSIIMDASIDMIIYGMGEKTIVDIASRLDAADSHQDAGVTSAATGRKQHNTQRLGLLPARQAQAVSQLQAHRATEQPHARRHSMASLRQYRRKGKPDAAAHDHTGNRRIIRPPIHTPPPSTLQRQANSGI